MWHSAGSKTLPLTLWIRLQTWTVCWSRSWTFPTPQSWWPELLPLPLQLLLLLRLIFILIIEKHPVQCRSWKSNWISLSRFFEALNFPLALARNIVNWYFTSISSMSFQEEEEAAPQVIQTSFTVKLNKFDASKKVVYFPKPDAYHCCMTRWPL